MPHTDSVVSEPVTSFEVQLGPDVSELTEPPEYVGEPSGRTVDIGIPFPGEEPQGRPERSGKPVLAAVAPEPHPTPHPESFGPEATQQISLEEEYRQIVANIDDGDWLDPDAAGVEAAKLFFAPPQTISKPESADEQDVIPKQQNGTNP
jgi:hypothetical protein